MELTDTCLEGIRHLRVRLHEGYMEETILLFRDVIEAFYQMEKAIQPITDKFALCILEEMTNQVRDSLDYVATFYEKAESRKAYEIIEMQLLPNYLNWKGEIDRLFTPYVII